MSLDFHTADIADQSLVYNEQGDFTIKLQQVVWGMFAVDQMRITEKNHREVFHRIAMWYFANDQMPPVSPTDIANLIGLSTNVSNSTDRQFELKIGHIIRRRAEALTQ